MVQGVRGEVQGVRRRVQQIVYIHRGDAESAERTIFCLSGDADRQRTSDPSGPLQPRAAGSSGESASPDSPEIIAFSATSVSRTSTQLLGASGR